MDFKRVAITGHSNGIGKGIYDYFKAKGTTIAGFDKTAGFDVSSKESRNLILNITKNCDLFFNNAYSGYAQVEVMKEWQQLHLNENHYIITTSSLVAEPLADATNNFPWLKSYSEEKYATNQASWEINQSGSKCKSIVIMPGLCQTRFYGFNDELYSRVTENNSIITVDELVKTVDLVLQSINGRNFISSMIVTNC